VVARLAQGKAWGVMRHGSSGDEADLAWRSPYLLPPSYSPLLLSLTLSSVPDLVAARYGSTKNDDGLQICRVVRRGSTSKDGPLVVVWRLASRLVRHRRVHGDGSSLDLAGLIIGLS
jgi:hypothetical protein